VSRLLSIVAFLSMLLAVVDARAQQEEATGPEEVFAGTQWGDSRGRVRKLCPATKRVKGDPNALACTTEVAGVAAKAVFVFGDEGLAEIRVQFIAYHADKSQYVADYHAVSDAVIERHGAPDAEDAVWTDDMYRDHPDQWGIALASGMVSLTRSWSRPDVRIVHVASGKNLDVLHVLRYTPPELSQ